MFSIWLFLAFFYPAGAHTSLAEPTLHQVRIEELSKSILAFDIANDSDLAAAALSDLSVRVWRLSSGRVIHEFSFPEPPTDQNLKLDGEYEPVSLHFSPDGRTLGVGFSNAICLYDVENWTEKNVLRVAGEDNLRPGIIATSRTPLLRQRTAQEAQAQSEQPIRDINQTMREWVARRHRGDGRTRVRDFAFTRDGMLILASYCRGGCWSSSGAVVAFASGTDPVRLWDLREKKIVWEKLYDPQGVISRVVVSPDGGRFIAVNSELAHCAVAAYDLSSGEALWSHRLGPCISPPMSNSCRAAGRSLRTGWTKPIAKIKNGDTQRFTKLQPATRLLISLRATEFPQRTFLQTGTGSYPSFGGELSFKYGTYKRRKSSFGTCQKDGSELSTAS